MAQRSQLGALRVPEAAAPAAPASGTLLYTNNGALYTKSAAGVEATVGAGAPTGSGMEWYTATAPTGWLMQDGGEYPIATYTALYNVLTANGTVFPFGANTNGSGAAGSTHFRTPNRKGRVGVGRDATQTEFDVIGETGGAKTHTITTGELPSHTHTQNSHNHTQDSHNHTQNSHNHGSTGTVSADHAHSVPFTHSGAYYSWPTSYVGAGGAGYVLPGSTATGGITTNHTHTVPAATATNIATTATNQAATATNQNTGGGGAHNNLQPYIVVNFIIKT